MPGNGGNMIRLRTKPDGAVVRVMPDGSEQPYRISEPDYARLDAMSEEEITAAAESDADSPPLTEAILDRMQLVGDIRAVRRRLGLSQTAFARRFRIPAASLRDWEQGRRRPGAAMRAYLMVIARESEAVERALADR